MLVRHLLTVSYNVHQQHQRQHVIGRANRVPKRLKRSTTFTTFSPRSNRQLTEYFIVNTYATSLMNGKMEHLIASELGALKREKVEIFISVRRLHIRLIIDECLFYLIVRYNFASTMPLVAGRAGRAGVNAPRGRRLDSARQVLDSARQGCLTKKAFPRETVTFQGGRS